MVKAKAKKRVVKKTKAKRKGPVILPNKMSALIKIALRDMRKVEHNAKFVIFMEDWYEKDASITCTVGGSTNIISERRVCSVCAAGSVMAFTLGAGNKGNVANFLHSDRNGSQLQAINSLRQGFVGEAAACLGIDYDPDPDSFNTSIPDYDNMDPEPFHEAMKALQAKLEKAGL